MRGVCLIALSLLLAIASLVITAGTVAAETVWS